MQKWNTWTFQLITTHLSIAELFFYCLTHKNEFVLQNKPTTYAQEVDKAVHPLQGYVCWVQNLQMGLSLFLLNAQIENTAK